MSLIRSVGLVSLLAVGLIQSLPVVPQLCFRLQLAGGSGVNLPPMFGAISASGNNLTMSGNNGIPNASYYVLTSTNIALSLSNWTRLLTNQFDVTGGFNFTNAVNPLTSQLFYRLQLP